MKTLQLIDARWKSLFSLVLTTSLLSLSGCQSTGPNAAGGGLLGGLTGSMIGASIGAHDGKATEGALIGAVAGGVAGAAIGDQVDEQHSEYQRQAMAQAEAINQSMVTLPQVIQMMQGGLSDEVIVNQIKTAGFSGRLNTTDLILLKQQGVSDRVIQELQSSQRMHTAPGVIQPVAVPVPVQPYGPAMIHHPPIFNGHHGHRGMIHFPNRPMVRGGRVSFGF